MIPRIGSCGGVDDLIVCGRAKLSASLVALGYGLGCAIAASADPGQPEPPLARAGGGQRAR